MKAVILAAGQGTRLGELGQQRPKVLVRVAGRELLYRHLYLLSRLGVKEFVIVVNTDTYEQVLQYLRGLDFPFRLVVNDAPERGNGYSLLMAKDHVKGTFLVVMGDHVYEEAFLEKAVKGKGLIVDREGRFIDHKEATKVVVEHGRVKDIGKGVLSKLYDTGFFVVTSEVFEYASEILRERGSVQMSEVVKRAGLEVTEVSGHLWLDVDTPQEARKATRLLVRNSRKDAGDGLVSRMINRRLSLWVSERVVDRLTPDQASLLSFLVGGVAAVLALVHPATGAVFYQLSSVLDGVDGEIARASLRTSPLGGWVDSLLDRTVDFLFLLSLGYSLGPSAAFWGVIAVAIFGSVMVSYSTERYRAAFFRDISRDIPLMRYLVGRRDERIFLTMVLCLLGMVAELFVLLALWTNLRVLATVALVCRKEKGKGP